MPCMARAMTTWPWPLLWGRSNQCEHDWLASQTRFARGAFSRRARHASGDAPEHSSAQPPPLGGLPPPPGAFQGHAAHLAEWSATRRPKGSWGVGRIRARSLTARLPKPPVRPGRETVASYGSRARAMMGKVHCASSTVHSPWTACACAGYLCTVSQPSPSGPSPCT